MGTLGAMAKVGVEGDTLVVHLGPLEKLGALRGDVRVARTAVRGVRAVLDPWPELRGIRAPGTGIPGVIALGTRRGAGIRDFAAVYRHRPAVVVELEGAQFDRLVVTDDDAESTVAALSAPG